MTRLTRLGRVADLLAWVLFTVILVALAMHHEPWADEAQAWLIARDASPWEIVARMARYEGTPPLWHLILMLPAKTHLPYAALHWVSTLVAVAGVALFLVKAPLPRWIKLLVPFGFILLYQYAVVARSYVLFFPALCATALAARRGHETQGTLVASLVGLASISIQGTLVASGLAMVYGVRMGWTWHDMASDRKRRLMIAGISFVTAMLLIALIVRPPRDINFPAGSAFTARRIFLTLTFANDVFAGIGLLTVPVLVASLLWFRRTGVLAEWLVPSLLLLLLFSYVYVKPWHVGTLYLVWLFALWRSFDQPVTVEVRRLHRPEFGALVVAVLLVMASQMQKAWGSARADWLGPYSGAPAVAQYLKTNKLDRGTMWAEDFVTTGVQPYFDRNLFTNRVSPCRGAFWLWSSQQQHRPLTDAYDVLLVMIKFPPHSTLPWQDEDFAPRGLPAGYIFTRYFGGRLCWGQEVIEDDAFVTLVKQARVPPGDLVLPRVRYQLGLLAMEHGDFEGARQQLEAALGTGERLLRVRFALAYLADKTGRRGEVASILEAPECRDPTGRRRPLSDVMTRISAFDSAGAQALASLVEGLGNVKGYS